MKKTKGLKEHWETFISYFPIFLIAIMAVVSGGAKYASRNFEGLNEPFRAGHIDMTDENVVLKLTTEADVRMVRVDIWSRNGEVDEIISGVRTGDDEWSVLMDKKKLPSWDKRLKAAAILKDGSELAIGLPKNPKLFVSLENGGSYFGVPFKLFFLVSLILCFSSILVYALLQISPHSLSGVLHLQGMAVFIFAVVESFMIGKRLAEFFAEFGLLACAKSVVFAIVAVNVMFFAILFLYLPYHIKNWNDRGLYYGHLFFYVVFGAFVGWYLSSMVPEWSFADLISKTFLNRALVWLFVALSLGVFCRMLVGNLPDILRMKQKSV